MRRKQQRLFGGVLFQSKHPFEQRAHHHRRRPDLVRRTGSQRLVIIPGKHFRHVPQRSIERQQCVRAQVLISWKLLVIPVFGNGCPSSEQRPYRAVVVSASAENRRTLGNNSHTPVCLQVRIRKLLNRGNGRRFIGQSKPHRNSRQHRQLIHLLVVLVERKRKSLLVCDPEAVVH